MLFSKKTKGIFVDVNDQTFSLARTSGTSSLLVVEELKSCPAANKSAVEDLLAEFHPKRSGAAAYVHATCGIYPPRRLVRRATLDPKRFKENDYLTEVVATQFRIEPEKHTLVALDPATGLDFDLAKGTGKEVLFAGIPSEDIVAIQKRLLEQGIYPDALELGSVATLGGLVSYLSYTEAKSPTLVLEVESDATQAFILSESGVDTSRPIGQGLDAMVPVVQKELGLKDEESARKLFYSNTFDFTGMAPVLIKKLIKELQSSIGFYEVQTGQSIGQVVCTKLPQKMSWLQGAIGSQLGVSVLELNLLPWLKARGITFADTVSTSSIDATYLGLFSLMLSHDHAVETQEKP
jgi:hypothetical protein